MTVTIRSKKVKDGGESLYLDIYHKGKRTYEFIGLTITKNDPNRRKKRQLAEQLRIKKLSDSFHSYYDLPNFSDGKEDFIKYYESKCTDRAYKSSLALLKKFAKKKMNGEILQFNKVDEKFSEEYKDWLISKEYKNSTIWVNILKFKTVLNKAVKDKIIPFNPAKYVKVKLEEIEKVYLTEEELKKLYELKFENKIVYNSFMFSCFTGLRYSDIKALTWGQIKEKSLSLKQQKTKGVEYLPLSESANNILELCKDGERDLESNNLVFDLDKIRKDKITTFLEDWCEKAKVKKKLTFHSARHTFGTLTMSYTNDVYAVSQLLGHKSLNTTMIYAKITNKKLTETINKLPTFK